MNCRKFASVMVYNSFRRLYRAISVRTKGFQSLAKFIKSSEVNQLQVFEQKTGLSTKDNPSSEGNSTSSSEGYSTSSEGY